MDAAAPAIRALREAAGLSRQALADAAGISPVFLAKIEQGRKRPSHDTLTRIARVFAITSEELLARGTLMQASNASTGEEMYRHLLRGTAVSGAAVLLGPFSPLIAGVLAARSMASVARRQDGNDPASQSASGPLDLGEVRRFLIAQIETMSDEQLMALLHLTPASDARTPASSGSTPSVDPQIGDSGEQASPGPR